MNRVYHDRHKEAVMVQLLLALIAFVQPLAAQELAGAAQHPTHRCGTHTLYLPAPA
jgi:hypothetical protein